MRIKLAAFALGMLWSGLTMAAGSSDAMDNLHPRGTIHLMVSRFGDGLGIHVFVPVPDNIQFPSRSLWFVKEYGVIKLLSCNESDGRRYHNITTESKTPIDISWEKGISVECFLEGLAVSLEVAKGIFVQVTYKEGLDTMASYTPIENK